MKHLDFIILDALALQIAFILSYSIYNGEVGLPYLSETYRTIGIFLFLLDAFLAISFDNFHNVLDRGMLVELSQTVKLALMDYAGLATVLFAMKMSGAYSRVMLTATMALYVVLSWGYRILRKRLLKRANNREPERSMLLVSSEKNVRAVLRRSRNSDEMKIAGLVLLDRDAEGETVCYLPVVANMKNAALYICREWVDEVFIYPDSLSQIERGSAGASRSAVDEFVEQDFLERLNRHDAKELIAEDDHEGETKNELMELMQRCREMGVPVHIRLGINGLSGKNFVEKVAGFNVLTCTINYASPLQLLFKRLMDILGGLVGSLAALIIMAIVGPKLKRESPGPVLFRQERIGRNGNRFKVYKIRSMYMDAEERKKEFLSQNRVSDGMMFKLDFDPRIIGNKILEDGTKITGIGEFIRSHSLDEFPQFFNVLKGEMSIVGTRPPTVDEWEKYQFHHRARLSFKPGVTGMWQVSGRSNITDFEEVVKLDTEYIENWSLGLDIKLILKTIRVMFTKEGAM